MRQDWRFTTEEGWYNPLLSNMLNEQFSSVFTKENRTTMSHLAPRLTHTAPPIQVTEKGVLKLLIGLNPYKTTCPDLASRL